jgi:hypothetical protein
MALAAVSYGQEFRGTISGLVTDGSGAPVAGAKVTATGVETGAKAEAKSDATGHYALPFLLPGDYDVTVQLAGFKEFVRKGVHLGRASTRISTRVCRWAMRRKRWK